MRDPKHIAPGQRLSASEYNRIVDELHRQSHFSPAPGMNSVDGAGGQHTRQLQDYIWAKITSGSGPYAWSQVAPVGDGTWAVLSNGLSGTTSVDKAYEINGNTVTPLPQYCRLFPTLDGAWLFSWGGGCDDSGITGLTTSITVVTSVSCFLNTFTTTSKLMVFQEGLLTHVY